MNINQLIESMYEDWMNEEDRRLFREMMLEAYMEELIRGDRRLGMTEISLQ